MTQNAVSMRFSELRADCKKCGHVLKLIKLTHASYSAQAQLEFHLELDCAVFDDSLNYLFFAPGSVNEMPERVNRIQGIYTGISTEGILRTMNQVFKLYASDRGDIKDKNSAQIYEHTGREDGLMLMKVRKGDNYRLIESSEFCSKHHLIATLVKHKIEIYWRGLRDQTL